MFLSYDDTEKAAEEFLLQYHPGRSIPVPIEHIVEIKLEISIVPRLNLMSQEGVDAFLSYDFKELYIDHHHYMGQTNRSRFTLAHEVGHFVLHRRIVDQIKNIQNWHDFILGTRVNRAVYEIHADNFAGCILMPRAELSAAYLNLRAKAQMELKEAGVDISDENTLISFIADEIGRQFDVSQKAAEIRLSKIFLKL